jgi:hypothetical protein
VPRTRYLLLAFGVGILLAIGASFTLIGVLGEFLVVGAVVAVSVKVVQGRLW